MTSILNGSEQPSSANLMCGASGVKSSSHVSVARQVSCGRTVLNYGEEAGQGQYDDLCYVMCSNNVMIVLIGINFSKLSGNS